MQPLAGLVPRPRLHLTRPHGVLAPNAKLRAALVPGPARGTSVPSDRQAHGAPARLGWARLLKRVFDLDLGLCGGGAACAEGRQLGSLQGVNPHRKRGVFAKQRTITRAGLPLGMPVPSSIREKVV